MWRSPAALVALAAFLISAAPAAAAPLDTVITSGPSGPTDSRSAKFRFSASVAGASFRCKLDAKDWVACTSPKKYSRLKQGPHEFRVRARKRRAVDTTPAVAAFVVDTTSPDTAILSGPTGVTDEHTPEFTFSSTEPGSFECRFGEAAFEPCDSPFTPASPLPDDSYTFKVRAVDAAGNEDETPASQAFGVETPITKSLETAQIAADLYFPDTINLDVPASCGGSIETDCADGSPLPPADQLGK